MNTPTSPLARPRSARLLVKALRPLWDKGAWTHRRGVLEKMLQACGSHAVEPLLDIALADSRSAIRFQAVRLLRSLVPFTGMAPLRPLLSCEDVELRVMAGTVFAAAGDASACDVLLAAALDEGLRPWLRSEALHALGTLRDPRAVHPLAELLARSTETNLVSRVTGALEAIGAPSVDALLSLIVARPDLRSLLCMRLGWIGDHRAVPTLERLLDDGDEWVRSAALFGLAKIGWRGEPARVERLLADSHPNVRCAAVECLAQMGRLQRLWTVVPDEDSSVRTVALDALAAARAPGVADALLQALSSDSDPDVRLLAARLLGGMYYVPALASLEQFERQIPRLFTGKTRRAARRVVARAREQVTALRS